MVSQFDDDDDDFRKEKIFRKKFRKGFLSLDFPDLFLSSARDILVLEEGGPSKVFM